MQDLDQQEGTLHFLDYWRVLRSRKEIIIAVTLLTVLTGTAFTFTLDRIFEAESRIRVRQDSLSMPVFEREFMQGYNPYFLRTEFEVIQSQPILHEVLRTLDLPRLWGKELSEDGKPLSREKAAAMLAGRLDVKQYRDTSLISIRASSKDPHEAVRIANEVANAYRDNRLSSKRKSTRQAIDVLLVELDKQKERVNQAEADLEDIREQQDVQFFTGGIGADTLRLQQIDQRRSDARVDMLVRKALYDRLKDLEGEELLNASLRVVNDASLASIHRQLIDSQVSLKLLGESYGLNHPEVRRVQAAVDELEKKVGEALKGLKVGLVTNFEVAQAKYQALEEELRTAEENSIQASREQILPFRRAEREVNIQRSILNALQAKVAQEGIELEVPRTPVEIIDHAELPSHPVSPNFTLNILLSLLLGLAGGIGLAFFIEYLDTSVKTVDDVERHLGLPVLGVIPQKVQVLYDAGPESPHAESYRVIRTNLQLHGDKKSGGSSFAVTSGGVGEGKSTTLANLAFVCATLGDRVLIVDSDLRRPIQHKLLGVSNRVGLTNILTEELAIEDVIQPTRVPNLHFLPSGKLKRTQVGMLDTERIRALMRELKERYDYVFFDSPPLMGISDASVLASEVNGVLLVVQYRKYPKIISARAKRILDTVGANTMGVVLNNINIMRDDYYYYYHSYHTHYEQSDDSLPEPKAQRKTVEPVAKADLL